MPKKAKSGKRSKAEKPSRVKYNAQTRHKNKINKLNARIKKLAKIKEKNPNSNVDNSIQELEKVKTKWFKQT